MYALHKRNSQVTALAHVGSTEQYEVRFGSIRLWLRENTILIHTAAASERTAWLYLYVTRPAQHTAVVSNEMTRFLERLMFGSIQG
jgi:hypothetical protein